MDFLVWVDVYFTDSAERTSVVSYLLDIDLADDGSNLPAVLTAMNALIVGLNALSWSSINKAEMRIEAYTSADVANVAANNQVHARSYGHDTAGNAMSFDLPAWDDAVYDQDSFNLLSTAYNTAALVVANLIRNPENANPMTNAVERSVSRTHKSRGKKVV